MTESRKELVGYVKGCLSKGYSSDSIKQTLKNYGYEHVLAEQVVDLCHKERRINALIVVSVLVLVISALVLLRPEFIGFFTIDFTAETPANESYSGSAWLYVNVTVANIGNNETNITFYLYNSTFDLINETTLGPGNRSINFTITDTNEVYYYNATVRNASQENSTSIRQIIFDTTNPSTFDLVYPADSAVSTNLTPILNWSNTSDTYFANFSLELSTSSSFSYANYTFNTTNISYYLDVNLSTDTTWYWRVTAYDRALNTRVSTSAYTYVTDTINVSIVNESYQPAPAYSSSAVQLNATVIDTNLNTVWVMSNETGNWSNTTVSTSSGNVYYTIIAASELSNQEIVGFRFFANDSAGSLSNGSLLSFEAENRLPAVVSLDLPSNNSVKVYDTVYFNWSNSSDADSDNFTFEVLVASDVGFTSVDANITNVSNNYFNVSGSDYNLTHGVRYWKVRTYDGYSYSNYSSYYHLNVIGSIVNITSPENYSIVYPGNVSNIVVEEVRSGNWVNNLTLLVNNVNYSAEYSTDWEYDYTIPNIDPTVLRITASGFNITPDITVTDYIDLRLSKKDAVSPTIDYICSNETYVFNGSNVTIIAQVSPDTLVNLSNFSVTTPSGVSNNYDFNLSVRSGLTYSYYYYNYSVNETGNYSLSVYVKDIENNENTSNYTFYSVAGSDTKQFTFTGQNVTSIRIKDICSDNILIVGTSVAKTIPDTALYNLEVVTNKPSVTFNNANLSGTVNVLNYTYLDQNISAPSTKRIVLEFELLSDFTNYDNVTILYNYSSVESVLDDESTLVMYTCESRDLCSWALADYDLNISTNIISVTLNFLNSSAVFLVAETASTTITTTTTGAGGGTVGSAGFGTVVVDSPEKTSLDIAIPPELKLFTLDNVTTTLMINNTGKRVLSQISLVSYVNGSPLMLNLLKNKIETLELNQVEYVNMTITSFGQPGEFKALIWANITFPKLLKLFELKIKVVERELSNKTYIKARLGFARNLLLENPECIELSELIGNAEIALNNTDYEKARSLTDSFIVRCKEMVGPEGKVTGPPKRAPSRIGRILIYVGSSMALLGILVVASILIIRKFRKKTAEKSAKEESEGLFNAK
jgi:hypothetical protein